ncbi:MAG TPA: amino acid adenylation domain-containing protein, partial [Ktedonobacteraceae bacterium]|nr:amino acid adenylation domain-containing protein [Ktedonobacteraceae bacterium]
ILAVLKAGAAYLPLDPAYPSDRLDFMLRDAQPRLLLTQASLAELFVGLNTPVLLLDSQAHLWQQAPAHNLSPSALALSPHHLAYLIYTSGSTGLPKGVMVEHKSLANLIAAQIQEFAIQKDSLTLQFASFSFDASISELFTTLCAGASLLLRRQSEANDTASLQQLLRDKAISHVTLPAAVLASFSDEVPLPALQTLVLAGDVLPPHLAARWRSGRRLINAYGPTESTICATMQLCTEDYDSSVPIGKPIANTRIYILNVHGQPAPIGVAGEIYIGGESIARGYLNRPELTAQRFLDDPFFTTPNARMYKTGDLGRWLPDGNIQFLGRNDFQVKIRGFRIELGEIEARLIAHPSVQDAVVVAREDHPGDKRLVAYLVAQNDTQPDAETLRQHLASGLPEYMIPAAYVSLDTLPLTPNGKLDRQALPAPGMEAFSTTVFQEPQGETEILLAGLWQELLHIDRVGRLDNFFQLGGHSLLAISLIEHMRQAGLQADIRRLFQAPTLAQLAASLRPHDQLSIPPNLIPENAQHISQEMLPLIELSQPQIDHLLLQVPGGAANVQDIYPLAPLQEGMLFHFLLAVHADPYQSSAVIGFDNRQLLDSCVSAMQAVIDRHDILRSAFFWEG